MESTPARALSGVVGPLTRRVLLALATACGLLALGGTSSAFAAGNAVYTSTDATVGGCQNASPTNNNNCNIYDSKDAVYLSGGPTNGPGLGEGEYFFAILAPGGQADPTDGSANNLSSPHDTYAERHFQINADGTFTYLGGTHLVGSDVDDRPVIGAMPFADTPNPGGVYILAVCEWLGDGAANDATEPSKCKYDAFRVVGDNPPPPGEALDPVVTKDAKATFIRTFPWEVEKSVECVGGSGPYLTYDDLVQKTGGKATCNYDVTATKGTGVDSAWKVKGTINVLNPNAGGAVTLTDVLDEIDDPSALCTVDTATAGLVVPAAGDAEYPYECIYSAAPSTENTNTATASWEEQLVGTDTLAASDGEGTATFAFDDGSEDNPKKVDDCTNVYDTLDGTQTYLGQTCETHTYERTVYFDVPSSGCADHSNTAKSKTVDLELKDYDSTSVRICGPVGGEGTMGFWQNKNGQALIKGSTPNAAYCAVRHNLRTYAPFQDLSATATCAQTATYVTNVIKAANASGATMNKMLKAQMLATALDVFFGRVPGNVDMDLTMVNSPIGSSSFKDVSAAFGDDTIMTVSEMLAYAASQSNSGGTAWYGQDKATQGLAKDAFDAINNGVALSI